MAGITKNVCKETANATFLLTQLDESSDVFPPLKNVISETLRVLNIVKVSLLDLIKIAPSYTSSRVSERARRNGGAVGTT